MQNVINFKHSGNSGDIIYALSGIYAVCCRLQVQAKLLIWIDRPAYYYEGATHPVYNSDNQNVMVNEYMFNMLKPLLEAQQYIHSVEMLDGQEVHVDLDMIRQVNINIPYGDIRTWYGFKFNDMSPDLSQKCISANGEPMSYLPKKYILVNLTERYRNIYVNYMFLQKYENVLFAGTPAEYELFVKQVPNAIFLKVENFFNLAIAIKYASLIIGNQSMVFGIAEQMKKPRVLEVCRYAPNVIPCGKMLMGFIRRKGLNIM